MISASKCRHLKGLGWLLLETPLLVSKYSRVYHCFGNSCNRTNVRTSKIREVQGFVAGVERGKKAVKASLTLPFSNGIVEGNMNKLKLVKWMGCGRAGFPLLRQRVLHAL